jgi:3-hydroxyacyl-CoA dehydrogenase
MWMMAVRLELCLMNPNKSLQDMVVEVGADVFGSASMICRNERLKRFLEEAVELARTGGLTDTEVHAVVAYELGRPVGPDLAQELGGAGVTLYSLSASFDFSLDTCVKTEIQRVAANKERCRAKHASKPAAVRASVE